MPFNITYNSCQSLKSVISGPVWVQCCPVQSGAVNRPLDLYP